MTALPSTPPHSLALTHFPLSSMIFPGSCEVGEMMEMSYLGPSTLSSHCPKNFESCEWEVNHCRLQEETSRLRAVLVLHITTTMPDFYMSAGVPNSSLHAYTASTLPSKSSLQHWFNFYKCFTWHRKIVQVFKNWV